MTTKTIELMDLPELLHERGRRHAIPQLPSRTVIDLTKRERHEGPLQQVRIPQDRLMRYSIEDQMLIYLIRVNKDIGPRNHAAELLHILRPQDRARGIMRRIQQDHSRARGNPPPNFI